MDVVEDMTDRSEQGNSQDQPPNIENDVGDCHSNTDILNRVQPEDKVTIAGEENVRASVLRGTKRGKTTSWIWNHGIEIVHIKSGTFFFLEIHKLQETTLVQSFIYQSSYLGGKAERVRQETRKKGTETEQGQQEGK